MTSSRAGTFTRTGFTLIEILVVLAVLGVLGVVAASTLRPDGPAVMQAARGLSSMVVRARLEALRTNGPVGLHLDRGTQRAFLFSDVDLSLTYTTGDSVVGSSSVVYGAGDLARVRLSGTGTSTFVFDARGVLRTNTGSASAVLTSRAGAASRTVTVNAQGRSTVQ